MKSSKFRNRSIYLLLFYIEQAEANEEIQICIKIAHSSCYRQDKYSDFWRKQLTLMMDWSHSDSQNGESRSELVASFAVLYYIQQSTNIFIIQRHLSKQLNITCYQIVSHFIQTQTHYRFTFWEKRSIFEEKNFLNCLMHNKNDRHQAIQPKQFVRDRILQQNTKSQTSRQIPTMQRYFNLIVISWNNSTTIVLKMYTP